MSDWSNKIFWLSNTNNRSEGSNEKMDNVRYGIDIDTYFNWCMTGEFAITFNYQVSNFFVIPQYHIKAWAYFLCSVIDFRFFETSRSWDISNIFIANDTRNMKTILEKRSILDIYSSNLISVNLADFASWLFIPRKKEAIFFGIS